MSTLAITFFMALAYGFGYLTGYTAPKPRPKYVVVKNGQYLDATGDAWDSWVGTPADAFPFSSYDNAESAALGAGGRVEVLPEAKHTPPARMPPPLTEDTATRHNHKTVIKPDCFDCANAMCNECDSGFTEEQVAAARVLLHTTMDYQHAINRITTDLTHDRVTAIDLYDVASGGQ